VHVIVDIRAAESNGGVLQEILEQLWHMIDPTYLEDQNLERHRELKDGGTLIAPTLARARELAVQTTHLIGAASRNCCLTARIHISTIDAWRVSVMVKCIPSVVILCTQD
jgi:hypothetical protein